MLYNGSTGATYDTDPLSGVVADQQNGWGTVVVSYPLNGIQNGAPDGIALVRPDATVEQFLGYEGTFTATNGPASGMTTDPVGVSEDGTTPAGWSLQLTGTGLAYGDFTWAAPAANTSAVQHGPGVRRPQPARERVWLRRDAHPRRPGIGTASPLVGSEVSIEGVVTDIVTNADVNGMHVQEERARPMPTPQRPRGSSSRWAVRRHRRSARPPG